MAEEREDPSQKTELPTERRLEEARKKGQVVLSKELVHWFMIVGMTLFIGFILPYSLPKLAFILRSFFEFDTLPSQTGEQISHLIFATGLKVGQSLGLVFLVLIGAALTGTFVQTKLNISSEPLKPKLDKISPLKGFERLFSKKTMVEFLKSCLKFSIILTLLILFMLPKFQKVETILSFETQSLLREVFSDLVILLILMVSLLTVIAGMDYIFQRFEFFRELRMTKQEIKEEHKESEGDPKIKQRRHKIRQDITRQNLAKAVPTATVIITNPTHYAIALRYVMHEMEAPVVVAKGIDHIALKIRDIARENKIPLYRNPSLAQLLYKTVDVEKPIHEEHYEAVAKVIRYILDLEQRRKML